MVDINKKDVEDYIQGLRDSGVHQANIEIANEVLLDYLKTKR